MTVAANVSESELESREFEHQCFGDFAMSKEDIETEHVIKMNRSAGSAD